MGLLRYAEAAVNSSYARACLVLWRDFLMSVPELPFNTDFPPVYNLAPWSNPAPKV